MNIRAAFVCIVIALLVIGVATYVPISRQHEQVVVLSDVSESIPLNAGEHIRQTIRPDLGSYSGVVLFSDEHELGDRQLVVRLEDTHSNEITQGYAVQSSYRSSGNVLQLEMLMPTFVPQVGQEYMLDISLLDGERMRFKSFPHPATAEQLISLSLIQNVPASLGLRQGIYLGVAFFLTVFLVSSVHNEKIKMRIAVCMLIIFAPLATLGYWYASGTLGIADWDYYFTLHDSYRNALLTYHTFPFWNPYICGGTAGLADPEFPMFSPTFLFELIFGVPVGIKMAISFSVAMGGIGMLMLARRLGRSVEAGLVAALAVAFGTVNLLEITEGHVNVLSAMWIPWILWAWHGMVFQNKKPIVCGIFLALTFLGGGIYLLMYMALAFIGLLLFVRNRQVAFIRIVQAALWAMGISAFKLVPVLLWLKQFPDDAYASSAYTLPWLGEILFGRHIHGADIILHQMSGWHEYGAYIGYVVLGLALIGVSYITTSRTVKALTVATIIAIILSILGPQLRPLFDQLWFFPRSSISRFILFAVIPIGLLASYGLDRIRWRIFRVLLIGIIAIDIFSLTYQLSEQAFVLPHVAPAISPVPYPIAYTPDRYDTAGQGSRTTRSYDAYKVGYGTLTYCSVLGPKPAVRTIYDEDNALISVDNKDSNVDVLLWGYNDVRVRVVSRQGTRVILNTNYADGWTANGQQGINHDGRVAIDVGPGESIIVFSYSASGFYPGLIITIGVCVFLGIFMLKTRNVIP